MTPVTRAPALQIQPRTSADVADAPTPDEPELESTHASSSDSDNHLDDAPHIGSSPPLPPATTILTPSILRDYETKMELGTSSTVVAAARDQRDRPEDRIVRQRIFRANLKWSSPATFKHSKLIVASTADEKVLQQAVKDGSMEYSKWPEQLEPLIEQLEHIVQAVFPIPTIPPIPQNNPQLFGRDASDTRPPVPPFPGAASPPPTEPSASQSQGSASPFYDNDTSLPPAMQSLFSSIIDTLRANFTQKPPHTIQRLAELVLHPTKHYRTLPAYLRALDRVVSVTSTADIFPLPSSVPLTTGVIGTDMVNGVVNGTNGSSGIDNATIAALAPSSAYPFAADSLGSDESLGGALLTPISWLKHPLQTAHHDISSDPLSDPGFDSADPQTLHPSRPDGAVTQGELIRIEQEAGIVPSNQQGHAHSLSPRRGPMGMLVGQHLGALSPEAEDSALEDHEIGPGEDAEGEDIPHARGPGVIGIEDMGLQDGVGLELTLGRSQGSAASLHTTLNTTITPKTDDTTMEDDATTGPSTIPPTADTDDLSGKPPAASSPPTETPALTDLDAEGEADADGEADPDVDGDILLTDADGNNSGKGGAAAVSPTRETEGPNT